MANFKSNMACENSLFSLGRESGGRLYMWTFTTREQCFYKDTAQEWRVLQQHLQRTCGFCGVRVFEFHPGGHGLHVHVVVNERFSVDSIRAAMTCRPYWGRIHVVALRPGGGKYVCKYLRKGNRPKGMRLWAAFGKRVRALASRVKDIRCDSGVHSVFRHMAIVADKSRRGWALILWQLATITYIHEGAFNADYV